MYGCFSGVRGQRLESNELSLVYWSFFNGYVSKPDQHFITGEVFSIAM